MSSDSGTNNYLKVQCHACDIKIDMSELDAFTQINCPNCEELLTVPKILDHYLLEEELGRNSCYKTYRASDLRLHRLVVVKLLNEEFRNNEETVRKFFKHAGRIALLNHPSLTPIYSSGEENGEAFVVSQYLDFSSLEDYFEAKKKQIKLYKSCYILSSVAKALSSTWNYDLGHFNLNLRNIVFDNDGHINVCDFGFSKLLFDEGKKTDLVAFFSPEYIAPEVVEDQQFSELSDIYAFGIIAYQLFTGQLPFVDIKPREQMNLRLKREIVAPNLINKSLPDELSSFCLSLCQKNPVDRLQSFEEVSKKLSEMMLSLFDDENLELSDRVMVNSRSVEAPKEPKVNTPVAKTVNIADMFEADAKVDKDYRSMKKMGMILYYIVALFIMPPVLIAGLCYLSLSFAPDSVFSERIREITGIERTVEKKIEPLAPIKETELKATDTSLVKTEIEALKPKPSDNRPKPRALNFFKARDELTSYYETVPEADLEKVKTKVIYLLKARRHFIQVLNNKHFKSEIALDGQKAPVTVLSVDRRILKLETESAEIELEWKALEISDLQGLLNDAISFASKDIASLSDLEQKSLNESLDKTRFHLALLIDWYELEGLDELKAQIDSESVKKELDSLL